MSRTQKRMGTKNKTAQIDRVIAYYKRFRNGKNRVIKRKGIHV